MQASMGGARMQSSMGGDRMQSSRHGPGQNEGKEASAAGNLLLEDSAMLSPPAADCTLDVNQSTAGEAVPHALSTGHDQAMQPDNQHASASDKGVSQPASVEGLHHANTATVEEPGVARQQPQMSKQELLHSAVQEPPSGEYEMPHNTLEAGRPQKASPLLYAAMVTSSAEALVTSSAEDAGQRGIIEHGTICCEGEHQAGQDMHPAGSAQSSLAEGAQQGIIEQVMHIMSPELPISLAMQRAAGLVEQDGLTRRPRWLYKRRRRQSNAEMYTWRKVGRGWRRRIFRRKLG